jgi:hypothetical protein
MPSRQVIEIARRVLRSVERYPKLLLGALRDREEREI